MEKKASAEKANMLKKRVEATTAPATE